jgi:hypothetical protein
MGLRQPMGYLPRAPKTGCQTITWPVKQLGQPVSRPLNSATICFPAADRSASNIRAAGPAGGCLAAMRLSCRIAAK